MNKTRRLNRAKCIREYCHECAGDSSKEVLLCQIFDCPLWQYRIGGDISGKSYQNRIRKAMICYSADFEQMKADGINIDLFSSRKAFFTVMHSEMRRQGMPISMFGTPKLMTNRRCNKSKSKKLTSRGEWGDGAGANPPSHSNSIDQEET